jgi:diadenosine tetraphosphatase ApaH/serine/threonine PP2A family protein phosphatase
MAMEMALRAVGAAMFGLLRARRKPAGRVPRVPEGVVVYAVGDIHGRLDLLSALLAKIAADAATTVAPRRVLVFLGDYVDRGNDSRGVLDRLSAGIAGFESVCLKGNHEEVLLDFLVDPSLWEEWRRFGGLETLASYGVSHALLFEPLIAPAAIRDAFLARLPERHLRFLKDLRLSYQCGDYYFVHAGARPGVALEDQVPADQLWIREEFLGAGDAFGGRVVVHGHTPKPQPEKWAFRIGIDTGAYLTGHLTAVRLEGADARFLHS